MARLFSIYFTYNDVLHNTMVSVRNTPFSPEYILGNLDTALRSLLPGNSILRNASGSLYFQNSAAQHSPVLMNSILKGLTKHLQTNEAMI